MELFNVTTRRKESIDDPKALQEAVLAGTHAFSQGSQVIVKSPDGTMGSIPAENAVKALQAGYQLETNTQKAVREYVGENKGISGALKVGLGQFADEALLGLPELILEKTGDPLAVAKKEALKKEHAFANALGGLTGFGASMVVGGPLWKGASKAGEKTANYIAQKLAVETSEEVGKRGINKAAASIAGKIAGSAVEGTIVGMPQAITEAALGDPDAAGETLLAGAGIGALFGAGSGLGKEFLGLGKKVSDDVTRAIGEQDLTVQKIARKVAQSMTGVNEDDIIYYLKNRDKVNAAPALEEIKNKIDDAYRQFSDDAIIKTEALKNTEYKLDTAYKNIQRDMAQARAPQELADDLVVSLDRQKAVLGEMSDEAEQILANSAVSLPKETVIDLISQVKKSVIPFEVGKKAKSAAKNLDTLALDIDAGFPDVIDGNELRSILRQVRDDIDYNQMAGEFNDRSNQALKAFTESVSASLKDQSPEYAQQMKLMYERTQALSKMSKAFGDRETAANTLTAMLKPGKEVKREILEEFSNLSGEDFFSRFGELVKVKDTLEAIKRGDDLRPQLLPNLFREKQELEIAARNAGELMQKIKKINPNSSQAAIRNMNRKDANIETVKAFERLEELTGESYLEIIKDRNILDNFQKGSTQGSRKVNLGAITGGVLGGIEEAAIGAGIGALMDNYGGMMLKNLLDRPSVAGLLFVEKAMKKTAQDIDRIPNILQRMSEGTKGIKKSTMAIDALFRLTDEQAKPSPKDVGEELEKVGDKIRTWLADPVRFEEMIGKFAMPLREGGAPNIANGLTLGAQKALSYLQEAIPKPPRPSSPFSPKVAWRPSDFELTKFAQSLQVAENPMVVLDELEAGTLTLNHMDALKSMFPFVYEQIQKKVVETAAENPKPLGYNERVKLSILSGANLDESLSDKSLLFLQERYMKQGEEDPSLGDQQFSPKQDVKLAQSNLTTLQSAMMQ